MSSVLLQRFFILILILSFYVSVNNYRQIKTTDTLLNNQVEALAQIEESAPALLEIGNHVESIQSEIQENGIWWLQEESIGQVMDGLILLDWLEVMEVTVILETYNPLDKVMDAKINVRAEVGSWNELGFISDQIKLQLDCTIKLNNQYQVEELIPNRTFNWMEELADNITWIKRVPYYTEIPTELKSKILEEVTQWIENKETKWCTPDQYIYMTPYKEDISSIDVMECQVQLSPYSTHNNLIFNVTLDTEVTLKNFQTQHYTYTYQIGMIEEEIMWIKFINTHEID